MDINATVLLRMIDSHLHLLNMKHKGLDPTEELKNAAEKGINGFLDIGIVPEDIRERISLVDGFDSLGFSIGAYPGRVEDEDPDVTAEKIILLLEDYRGKGHPVHAIGEAGIDLHWNYGTPEKQIRLFRNQLEIASDNGMPVIIHSRKADKELLSCLPFVSRDAGGIMHCFSSDWEIARKTIDRGLHVSFAGNVTYKSARDIQDAAKRVPVESILIETDAPFLAPQKHRGSLNRPAYIMDTYDWVASLRGISPRELEERVETNFKRLFRL